jgi:hypothetical protein
MDEHCSCRKSGSGSCVVAAFHAFVLSIGGKEVWHSAWIVVPVFVAEKDNFSSTVGCHMYSYRVNAQRHQIVCRFNN